MRGAIAHARRDASSEIAGGDQQQRELRRRARGTSSTPNSNGASAAPSVFTPSARPKLTPAARALRAEVTEQRAHHDRGQQERRDREQRFGEQRRRHARSQRMQQRSS